MGTLPEARCERLRAVPPLTTISLHPTANVDAEATSVGRGSSSMKMHSFLSSCDGVRRPILQFAEQRGVWSRRRPRWNVHFPIVDTGLPTEEATATHHG